MIGTFLGATVGVDFLLFKKLRVIRFEVLTAVTMKKSRFLVCDAV
jgi:hypothetical protein